MLDVAGAAAQVRFLGTSSDKCARQAWRRAVQELGDLRWKEAKAANTPATNTASSEPTTSATSGNKKAAKKSSKKKPKKQTKKKSKKGKGSTKKEDREEEFVGDPYVGAVQRKIEARRHSVAGGRR